MGTSNGNEVEQLRQQKITRMTETALVSALLCVISPFTIPMPGSPVPVSLAMFGVFLAAGLLGVRKGVCSVLVYLLLGMAGLPVFSGFSGGPGVLFGPTGGYLLGYLPCVAVTGWWMSFPGRLPDCVRKFFGKELQTVWNVLSMLLGLFCCYLCGTIWFLALMKGNYSLEQALILCVLPYLLPDFVKILAAAALLVSDSIFKINRGMK